MRTSSPRRWKLTRRCALSPRVFMLNMGALIAANLVIGAAFGCLGYLVISVCCAIASGFVAVAGWVYGLHAADGEELDLGPDTLHVRIHRGGVTQSAQFNPPWTHLEQRDGKMHLCSGKRKVEVGRWLSPLERRRFAADVGRALAMRR